MAEEAPEMSPQEKLVLIGGTVFGGVVTGGIVTQLPIAQAAIFSSLLLAGAVLLCASASHRLVWWMGVGAIAGAIIGLGGMMAGELAEEKVANAEDWRLVLVVSQCLAGFLAGIILGRRQQTTEQAPLTTLLGSLGGITAGIYALVITGRFIAQGLIPAQELLHRLETSTTVLATLLAVPGVIGYLLTRRAKS
jgi:CDP-diglyceride synthetase